MTTTRKPKLGSNTPKGLIVKVKKLTENAMIPKRQTKDAACFDLVTTEGLYVRCINADDKSTMLSTGLAFEIPEGYHMKVFMRSGIALKTKLRLSNQVGIIDADYRGELKLLIDNLSRERVYIAEGTRLAQCLIEKNVDVSFEEVTELSETERSEGGFGSTGDNK